MRFVPLALLVVAFGGVASAQPYPDDDDDDEPAAAAAPQAPAGSPDGGVPGPIVYDTTNDPWDSDPDIDDYDPRYDVHYDNIAAQGYDDGYDPNAYTYFESALSPYGQWVTDASWGRVWVPSPAYVGYDFFPYATGGHWVLTEYGWTWVSDWDWGWAPFHYGRWVVLAAFGWCWIPGTTWGPAWVSWRSGGGYVGWTPLPPAGVTIGPPRGTRSPWKFVLAGDLGRNRLSYLPNRAVPGIFAKTSVITNLRTVSLDRATLRVNAGPTNLHVGAGVGASMPVMLKQVSPRALPQLNVTPRAGVPLQARPWVRAGVVPSGGRITRAPGILAQPATRPRSIPIGPRPLMTGPSRPSLAPRPIGGAYTARPGIYVVSPRADMPPRPMLTPGPARPTQIPPVYQAPPVFKAPQPPIYRPTPSFSRPSYSAPTPSFSRPSYSAPTPSFSRPSYSAPAPSFSRPSYSAPAPSFSRPSFSAPAPSFSRPSFSRPSFSAPAPGGFSRSAPMMRR